MLCAGGAYSVAASLPIPYLQGDAVELLHLRKHDGSFAVGFGSGDDDDGAKTLLRLTTAHIPLLALGVQYVAFAVAFIIDARATRLMTVKEDISILRNLAHWLSAPFVVLAYSLIAFVSILRFVFEGKKMARHDMAGKTGLKSIAAGGGGGSGDGAVAAATPAPVVAATSTSSSVVGDNKQHERNVLCSLPELIYFGSVHYERLESLKPLAVSRTCVHRDGRFQSVDGGQP
jgi:hypothetical protein